MTEVSQKRRENANVPSKNQYGPNMMALAVNSWTLISGVPLKSVNTRHKAANSCCQIA